MTGSSPAAGCEEIAKDWLAPPFHPEEKPSRSARFFFFFFHLEDQTGDVFSHGVHVIGLSPMSSGREASLTWEPGCQERMFFGSCRSGPSVAVVSYGSVDDGRRTKESSVRLPMRDRGLGEEPTSWTMMKNVQRVSRSTP